MRKRLKPYEAQQLGFIPKPKENCRYPRYSLTKEQAEQLNEIRNVYKPECVVPAELQNDEVEILTQYRRMRDQLKQEGTPMNSAWLKTQKGSYHVNIPQQGFNVEEYDFAKAFMEIKPIKTERKQSGIIFDALFDKLVFSDAHIGMDASDSGRSLYDLSWTKEDIERELQAMIQATVDNQRSNVLYITDLGDFLDGFNGQTTRGGHKLPQNMTNTEAFDLAFKFKITLIESLLKHYDFIDLHNVCNDNHAGDFAYFLNKAVKEVLDRAYTGRVKVTNQLKFISYRIIHNYCFVLCHGKDNAHMKYGLKAKIDANGINKIIEYMNEKGLLSKGYEIIFEKGDSHQLIFDSASSDVFKYYNYPAFSPSSNWVQTNFQKGKSGFIFFNYYQNRKNTYEFL